MYLKLPLYGLALFSLSAQGFTPSVTYQLTVNHQDRQFGNFSVDTSTLNTFTLRPPRSLSEASKDSLSIQCINGDTAEPANYGEPLKCEQLNWRTSFHSLDDLDINLSEQTSYVSSSGWWVLFEWDTIPRFEGVRDAMVCTQVDDHRTESNCQSLPSAIQPPLILPFGTPTAAFQEQETHFLVYTDIMGRELTINHNQALLSSQYQYLSQLLNRTKATQQQLSLVWAGINESHGMIGGAAGSNAFVSNYAIGDGGISKQSKERLFWVSAHELFHMLAPYSYPTWLSESLAHYYGYKSLAKFGAPSNTPQRDWDSQRTKMPNSDARLYEAHTKVTQERQMQYYGLFYVKGAAFWQRLDELLMRHGDSLDNYLPQLAEWVSQNGHFDSEFETTMSDIVGKKAMEQLLSQFLK
ncbi:hypothetical protein [Ferrimonas sp. YFM]|uniref:hypothetical protein n=1 Tax=Ferrimonas sp. YFM TaxID=3028878 RepID=UPI0025722B04|nr:hypothetical protein [Ferrimonas sp. YFM]BDY05254.1 hypothetical protein F0521_22950 [Ferrimonas sp. YFM]